MLMVHTKKKLKVLTFLHTHLFPIRNFLRNMIV